MRLNRMIFLLSAICSALCLITCMANDKPKFTTIDNEWFTCELVDWERSSRRADGDIFQISREWDRFAPDGIHATISISYFEKSHIDKGIGEFIKKLKPQPIETPAENLKYHYIYEITDALEPMMFENWIFVTEDCAIQVSYLYRRDEDPKIIDKNREIAKRTVNTLKIK